MADAPTIMRDTATLLQTELPSLTRYQDKQIILRIIIAVLLLVANEWDDDDD